MICVGFVDHPLHQASHTKWEAEIDIFDEISAEVVAVQPVQHLEWLSPLCLRDLLQYFFHKYNPGTTSKNPAKS